MANVILKIGKEIEVAAEDLLKWVTHAEKAAPPVLAALGVLAGGVTKALADVATGAGNPASLALNLGGDIEDFKAVWPEAVKFFESFGVKV